VCGEVVKEYWRRGVVGENTAEYCDSKINNLIEVASRVMEGAEVKHASRQGKSS
jgi:hypothetical protein